KVKAYEYIGKLIKTSGHGLDGVEKMVFKLTSGHGPREFPRVYRALSHEVDLQGAMNMLMSATRTADIGHAIIEYNRIINRSSFAESIEITKSVTRQSQFKYALEELTHEANKLRLSDVVDSLYKVTGVQDIQQVQQVFKKVFEINAR
ncbi:uncharacterized protein LOC113236361, partial [Hyposmocoma kahamanoa]|uniref:uncharacterized protein LOC113236361 n=1 Tax=Hyposmocoma kahamanoa TaxID=1477025 RepID=UPI000E6D5EE2